MDKKTKQLGMPIGTASNRLRKMIILELLRQTEQDKCYRCGEPLALENLSIEHPIPWLDSEEPVKLFFDLDNIAFSHVKCNSGARRYTGNEIAYTTLICGECKQEFQRDASMVRFKTNLGQKDFYCSYRCAGKATGKGYGRRELDERKG